MFNWIDCTLEEREETMSKEKKQELKKVMVLGAGKSGIAATNLLVKENIKVVLYDSNEEIEVERLKEQLENGDKVKIVLGKLTADMIKQCDLAVISPGIPMEEEFVKKIQAADKPIWSEIELAYYFSKGKIAAITGTNGKTTTTALVGEIMANYYESTFVVGNIGIPYTKVAADTKDISVITAEISSFQLETIHSFRPEVSAILNITPDHLNRHKTMENYILTKQRICENQSENQVCVLNYDDMITRKMAPVVTPKVMFFSRLHKLEEGVYLDNDAIMLAKDKQVKEVIKLADIKLLGGHNIENIMAAIAISVSMQVPLHFIKNTIKEFKGVEHRIEFVDTIGGVTYYNDSKGTNPDAAIKGIQAMVAPTLLIGGGYDKGVAFDEWIEAFDGKVRYLVLLGQTADLIAETARKHGFEQIIKVESLEEAVATCKKLANPGDAVLLSPACASWGMFDNYEQRGDLFKEYVRKLKG